MKEYLLLFWWANYNDWLKWWHLPLTFSNVNDLHSKHFSSCGQWCFKHYPIIRMLRVMEGSFSSPMLSQREDGRNSNILWNELNPFEISYQALRRLLKQQQPCKSIPPNISIQDFYKCRSKREQMNPTSIQDFRQSTETNASTLASESKLKIPALMTIVCPSLWLVASLILCGCLQPSNQNTSMKKLVSGYHQLPTLRISSSAKSEYIDEAAIVWL